MSIPLAFRPLAIRASICLRLSMICLRSAALSWVGIMRRPNEIMLCFLTVAKASLSSKSSFYYIWSLAVDFLVAAKSLIKIELICFSFFRAEMPLLCTPPFLTDSSYCFVETWALLSKRDCARKCLALPLFIFIGSMVLLTLWPKLRVLVKAGSLRVEGWSATARELLCILAFGIFGDRMRIC